MIVGYSKEGKKLIVFVDKGCVSPSQINRLLRITGCKEYSLVRLNGEFRAL